VCQLLQLTSVFAPSPLNTLLLLDSPLENLIIGPPCILWGPRFSCVWFLWNSHSKDYLLFVTYN